MTNNRYRDGDLSSRAWKDLPFWQDFNEYYDKFFTLSRKKIKKSVVSSHWSVALRCQDQQLRITPYASRVLFINNSAKPIPATDNGLRTAPIGE